MQKPLPADIGTFAPAALPARFSREGLRLGAGDIGALAKLTFERDLRIEHLYTRAFHWYARTHRDKREFFRWTHKPKDDPTYYRAPPRPATRGRAAPAAGLEQAMGAGLRPGARALAAAFASGRPFPHVIIDEFLEPGFSRELLDQFPALDRRRFAGADGLGRSQHERLLDLGPAYRRLNAFFSSPEFLRTIGAITGIRDLIFDPVDSYFTGGVHENFDGNELKPHVDYNYVNGLYRRLNVLLYLNPIWKEEWGGSLQLHSDAWPTHRGDRVKTILPLQNRCVVFRTDDRSWHGFPRLALPPGGPSARRSVALYLYTKRAPANMRRIPSDMNLFVDLPLPEQFRTKGHRLTASDVGELARALRERDRRIEYLESRALYWRRQAHQSKAELRLEMAVARFLDGPAHRGS